jgi:hypothetical protein
MLVAVRWAVLLLLAGCAADADSLGIGAECEPAACPNGLECMGTPAGGTCVKHGCASDDDCPRSSSCLVDGEHGDCVRSCDVDHCVRTCILYHTKPEECHDDCPSFEECNAHRSEESPAFCISTSSSADGSEKKICMPLQEPGEP